MRESYKLIFERSVAGHKAYDLPYIDVPERDELIPANLMAEDNLDFPELAEVDLVRHYTNLTRRNFGVDNGFYPLGSCTMKYNPKINEEMPQLFNGLHPYADTDCVQGALTLLYDVDRILCEITGMDKCTLSPAAGAHGELTGLMVIRAYHEMREDFERKTIIVPDAAHGTNPASASMAGFKIKEIKSAEDGGVDLDALRAAVGSDTAGLMLTNPSTLGLFEKNIKEVAQIVHDAGGLLYYDGANLNAIMGVVRPGDMGFDVMHMNLHKTFSTPHGGGGPGSGPVAVKAELIPYLPRPVIFGCECSKQGVRADYDRPVSLGRVKGFFGNFGVIVKAYAYLLSLGGKGLREASQNAVLNANYIKSQLCDTYTIAYDRICMHEFVLTPTAEMAEKHISTMDIAKSLIDYGYHPPTIYFPLIVHEAMMIEPTETESRETLDEFIAVMKKIAKDALENPDKLHAAPHNTVIGRPDDVKAAKSPVVVYTKPTEA